MKDSATEMRIKKKLPIGIEIFEEIGSDKTLFDGLEISRETGLCEAHMGKYPVICVSLKGVEADTFENAKKMLCRIINAET